MNYDLKKYAKENGLDERTFAAYIPYFHDKYTNGNLVIVDYELNEIPFEEIPKKLFSEKYLDKELAEKDVKITELRRQLENMPRWHRVADGDLPSGDSPVKISDTKFACWNAHEQCWDTDDGDDYYCNKDEVEMWYGPIPKMPRG